MVSNEHFVRSTKRTIKGFGSNHRIAGLIVLVVVAMLGTVQWMHASSGAATSDSAQQVSPANEVSTPFEYFPAQYVNQATQPEKHIESF